MEMNTVAIAFDVGTKTRPFFLRGDGWGDVEGETYSVSVDVGDVWLEAEEVDRERPINRQNVVERPHQERSDDHQIDGGDAEGKEARFSKTQNMVHIEECEQHHKPDEGEKDDEQDADGDHREVSRMKYPPVCHCEQREVILLGVRLCHYVRNDNLEDDRFLFLDSK